MILDLSHLPNFDWNKSNAGYSVARDACLPSSTQRATAWAKRHRKLGARIVRLHKFDGYLKTDENYQQLQWMLNALKRQGIPAAIEFSCEQPLTVEGIQRLCQLDLSNVVLAAIKNETVLDDYAKWEAVIRDSGYSGRLFGSNASMMGGEYGDCESLHLYVGHPRGEYFFSTCFPDHSDHNAEPNEIIRKTALPFCVMECGAVYPNPQRGWSDVRMYDKLLSLGSTIVCAYSYCESALGMGDIGFGEDMWGFAADPLRLMAFQYLAQKVHGIPAVPFSTVKAESVPNAVYLTSPTYRVV